MTDLNGIALLEQFCQLLEQEREVLRRNDGAALTEIVAQKQQFLEALPEVRLNETESAEAESIVARIRQLQGTNLLLTKQALKFQESVRKAIQKEIVTAGTYSKYGQHTKNQQQYLLNHSL